MRPARTAAAAALLGLLVPAASSAAAKPLPQCLPAADYDGDAAATFGLVLPLSRALSNAGYYSPFFGVNAMVVDPQGGADTGGAMNPQGSYSAGFIDQSILPTGACDAYPSVCNTAFACGDATCGALAPLAQSDAFFWYGCTPPPVKYFGYDLTINRRAAADGTMTSPGINLGDALSHRRVNRVAGTADGVFNQPVLVVFTADQDAADAVFDAFAGVGVPRAAMTLFPIDAATETARFYNRTTDWRESRPDFFGTLLRASLAEEG